MISGSCWALVEPGPGAEIHCTIKLRRTPRLYWGRRGHSRRPHQRHCGTGIWRDRDIAASWRYLKIACASLPTRSPTQPRTAARKAGVLHVRERLGARDRLSAGGRRIRTLGPPSVGFTQTPGSPRIATPGAQIGGKMAKLPVWHRCVISAADHPLRLGQIGPVLRSPSRAA